MDIRMMLTAPERLQLASVPSVSHSRKRRDKYALRNDMIRNS